jgi:hypothetical protein
MLHTLGSNAGSSSGRLHCDRFAAFCRCVLPCLQAGGGSGLAALLGPQRLAALLPKLYRLCHDPSPKVSCLHVRWVVGWSKSAKVTCIRFRAYCTCDIIVRQQLVRLILHPKSLRLLLLLLPCQVSDSMSAIWTALLDDPRAAVDAHFDDIIK